MNTKKAAFALIFLSLTGCSGTLYTVKGNTKEEGVYTYPQITVIDVYEYTTFTNKDGEVLARKDGTPKCKPKYEDKIVVRTDYNAPPLRIYYDSALLEQFKFSVTLKDGVLESVNTESTPDRGETLKNLTSAAKDAASIAAAAPSQTPLCNAEPRYYGTYKAPDIDDFINKPK
ncbi:MAG: hypothetical protein KGZ88_11450 [Methylomicrobium sp.]|nr:hypothetical protein [Methylomicrobium sp.]